MDKGVDHEIDCLGGLVDDHIFGMPMGDSTIVGVLSDLHEQIFFNVYSLAFLKNYLMLTNTDFLTIQKIHLIIQVRHQFFL
jgi:hypothetical protein